MASLLANFIKSVFLIWKMGAIITTNGHKIQITGLVKIMKMIAKKSLRLTCSA